MPPTPAPAAGVMLRLDASALASPSARTITGLAVPFGKVGTLSIGSVKFSPGSLTWADDLRRVKLLVQHDAERSVGYATELVETPEGIRATFAVVDGPEGDRALTEAASGARDGLSVGVMLDAESVERLWASDGTEPVDATGTLRETSLVSIPAFDDARVDAAASAPLIVGVSAWATAATPTREGATMPPTAPTEAAPAVESPAPAPLAAAPAPAPAPLAAAPAPAPAPVAAAGNVTVVAEPATYTFNGQGSSLVRDVWAAKFGRDPEAEARLDRFAGELATGGPSVNAMAAVAGRTDHPQVIPPGYRGDMLVSALDKGRPLVARIGTTSINDATPFKVPVEGEFASVAVHTEETSHAAEGALTVSEVTVTPVAISGAFRLSREIIDASNPAIDAIAARAMARDYRYLTETRTVNALIAADATPVLNINTVMEVRTELAAFAAVDEVPADFLACSTSYFASLLADVDSTGRPHLPFVGPTNAMGDVKAGYTGASIDGVEVFRASKVTDTQAWIIRAEDVLLCESGLQTFTFSEVEGPGVIKLALWGYFAAQVLRASGVSRLDMNT